ncbi:hypothetical protein NQ315_007276 [Exocentrus adspersus]|uniref:CDAN1-interacting nuclease 1 n=1 Tax=Exocentrus adspersus TaxID=1586481 RepID=A0AAV8WD75_9CUCU|nr:hypothetical protein NQ315_007276 [Exocentrus adspersus]
MDLQSYNNIVSIIRQHHGLSHDCMKLLIQKYPQHSYDTLYSILSLEYQKRMKCTHIKTLTARNKYWDLYRQSVESGDNPGIIVRLAAEYDVAPCLVAKIILGKYFENAVEEQSGSGVNINFYLRDTCLIPDMDLAYEVFLCTLYDNIYSPLTETMKASLGQQYEVRLYKEAQALGLAFRDEEHLRKNGYDKTPDCKLEVPVAIDGFVVNWIESKALFGEEEVHKEYMKSQYLSYWNRFGPGLVIYWFGYLQKIVEPADKRFIIRDHLPTNLVQIPINTIANIFLKKKMEGQKDTLKVYRHHQHSRIQKEGDEMWISSEDLRTEGSSDEETHAGAGASTSRSRRTKKNRKQRKSTAVEASKSTTSTTSQPDEEKSTAETNIDINIRRFSILDNPFFTDIFPDSAAGASAISLGSTDSGVDALNLESRWRPKRGSLKYPILVEGTSVEV